MQWLRFVIAAAGAVAGWRWVLRPLRRGWRELLILLGQVRAAAGASQQLAREIEALSGAVVQLVIAVLDDQRLLRDEHEELRRHAQDLTQMVIDLDADVRRVERRMGRPSS